MTGILIKRGESHAGRSWPCDNGGRDWSASAVSQLMPRISCHHQKLKETLATDFVVLSHPVCGTLLQQP